MPLPLRVVSPLMGLALLTVLPPRASAADDSAARDEQTLHDAGLPTDGPGLLDFLHKRVLPDADQARARALIRRLGDDDYDVREKASHDLQMMGSAARPTLREALQDPDPEVRCRALRCLAAIDQTNQAATLGAAIRTVGRLRPPGAAETLLAVLPSLEDAELVDEACRAMAASAVRMGQVDPALVRALGDQSPLRRAAAGEALTRAGAADQRPAVEKLLQDADAGVRQRVGLALLEAGDRAAVPALIALLGDSPPEQGDVVEEYLRLLAGEKAPSVSPGDDEASRRRCRDAWQDWWKDHGASVDLTKVDFTNRRLGYTLVTEMDLRAVTSTLIEYDRGGKERWRLGGLPYAVDAQMVGGDHVLVAEYTARSVSEMTTKGDVVWQYHANNLVLGARRLPNGDTFVVIRNQLTLLDKDGKEKSSISRPQDVCTAAKFRDGSIALLTNSGYLIHLDESGKELKSLPLGLPVLPVGQNIEALPDGHVLIPVYTSNKVVEVDEDGKTVWEVSARQPSSVSRLPNGHVLVASRLGRTVVELDHDGQEVRSWPVEGRPFRATQR